MGNLCGTAHTPGEAPEKNSAGSGHGAIFKITAIAHRASAQNILKKPTGDLSTQYQLGQLLGKGQFGTTRIATDKQTGERYACKSISKAILVTPEHVEDVRREVEIMEFLAGHPHVVTIKDVFEDKQNVHILMELCEGGDLFDKIFAKGHYTEKDAARIIRNIVQVVQHCHSMNVIHRDLKPENFLLASKSEDAALKATDFGTSVFFKEGTPLIDAVGTPHYVAPEVLQQNYGKEADLWSCGVILYILLCGNPPFSGDSAAQIYEAVLNGPDVDFSSEYWQSVSDPAKDIIRRMLVRDPAKRATAAEVLDHEWVREDGVAGDNRIEAEVLQRIKGFAAMNRLKKEALMFMAHSLPEEDIAELRDFFKSCDPSGSGMITAHELRQGLHLKGSGAMAEGELEKLLTAADVHEHPGRIDYEEFLAATISLSQLRQEENLMSAFQHFDTDGSGFITEDKLRVALQASYPSKAQLADQIKNIMAEVDTDNDGVISYAEFCTMMRAGYATGKLYRQKTTVLVMGRTLSKGIARSLTRAFTKTMTRSVTKTAGRGAMNKAATKTAPKGELARSKTKRKGQLLV